MKKLWGDEISLQGFFTSDFILQWAETKQFYLLCHFVKYVYFVGMSIKISLKQVSFYTIVSTANYQPGLLYHCNLCTVEMVDYLMILSAHHSIPSVQSRIHMQ